ncbi:MAG: hypothetical protein JETT_1354 [Candidatus Jettenia ecosi]|uniref:Uncharacterized protein n=1 Tax=Candidatus Jettenia ecosi TaxID=2494326 RepID=A0A533QCC7_9BACT|nr:MAG: hypothetical protein JETT_1354 [Candidatus Jettenia ecosi]
MGELNSGPAENSLHISILNQKATQSLKREFLCNKSPRQWRSVL